MIDLRDVKEADKAKEWPAMIAAMHSGADCLVPEWFWDYFLGVLPPVQVTGCPFGFVFAEGYDPPTWFYAAGAGRPDGTKHEDDWPFCCKRFKNYGALRNYWKANGLFKGAYGEAL